MKKGKVTIQLQKENWKVYQSLFFFVCFIFYLSEKKKHQRDRGQVQTMMWKKQFDFLFPGFFVFSLLNGKWGRKKKKTEPNNESKFSFHQLSNSFVFVFSVAGGQQKDTIVKFS